MGFVTKGVGLRARAVAVMAFAAFLLAFPSAAAAVVCGDGIKEEPEECDDSNVESGDACNGTCGLDSDGDHIADIDEVDDDDLMTPPTDSNEDTQPDYLDDDSDGDGVLDHDEAGDDRLDTAPVESDDDGIPDFRDPDSDDDGIGDHEDNCRTKRNADQVDRDGDFIGDACTDADEDGVPDLIDNCADASNNQDDLDGDGIGDACDPDIENDGIIDRFGLGGGGCGCDSGDAPLGGLLGMCLVMFLWRRRTRVMAVLCLLALTGSARAQTAPVGDIPVDRFRLASDGHGMFDVEWAGIPAHKSWHLAMWVGVANDPLVLYEFPNNERTRAGSLVSERAESGLVASLALWDRVQLGLAADVVVYQHRDDSPGFMSESLPAGGLGDLRLIPKVKVWGHCTGVCVAVIPAFTVPVGSANGHLREAGPTFMPEVAVSGSLGPLRVSSNLGYRARKRTEIADLVVDDEIYLRAGVGYRFVGPILPGTELAATLATATAAAAPFENANRNGYEIMLGVVQPVWGGVNAMLGGGAGLGAGFGTPDWRVVLGARMNIGDATPDTPEPAAPTALQNGTLRGRVTHPDGTVTPQKVLLRFDDNRSSVELNVAADGSFELAEVAPGSGTASASGPGLRPAEQRFAILPQQMVELQLACTLPEGQLRGSVRAFDGRPVMATVVIGSLAREVVADGEGLFELPLPIGSYQVQIRATGFQAQTRTVTVMEDGVTVLNVDLRKGR